MRRARALALAFAAFAASLLAAAPAAAEVPLCLAVTAPQAEREGFERLVRSEVARHPSHRVVDAGCRSHLRVELFDSAGGRYLTAQIDAEVPARYPIREPDDLAPRLEDAVRLALRNDPAALADDPARMDAMQRFGQAILVRGRTTFRVELLDVVSRDARGVATLPGVGVSLWRGSGHFQIGVRVHGEASLAAGGAPAPALEVLAGLDGCFGYELFDTTSWTPYAAGCAGVEYVQFAARLHAEATSPVRAHDVGFAPSLRLGARFFRYHAFDLDLFAQGYVPVSNARDVDGVLLPPGGVYTPSVQFGLAIGF